MEVMANRWQHLRLLPPLGDGEAEEDGAMVMPWAVARSKLNGRSSLSSSEEEDAMVEMLRAMEFGSTSFHSCFHRVLSFLRGARSFLRVVVGGRLIFDYVGSIMIFKSHLRLIWKM
jgi:hypothetical protein